MLHAFNLIFIGYELMIASMSDSCCPSSLYDFSLYCRSWELTAPWNRSRVEVPAKFIVGDLDPTYNTPAFKEFMNINELKKHVPLLEEVVVMEGVGHFVQEEKADEITQHIHDFFQKF